MVLEPLYMECVDLTIENQKQSIKLVSLSHFHRKNLKSETRLEPVVAMNIKATTKKMHREDLVAAILLLGDVAEAECV